MSQLYTDENFDDGVLKELRRFGHDVLTVSQAGKAGQKIPDNQVPMLFHWGGRS